MSSKFGKLNLKIKASPVYTWDNNVKRYRKQGRFVSQDEVFKYRDKYLEGETEINRQNATQLFDRQITIGQFEDAIRDSLKRVYTVQFMLAKGGRAQMTQRDWGALGQILREQYHYLRNKFIADLVSGKYTIDQLDLVINRMGLYIQNSSQQAFERGNLERLRGTEVRLLWKYSPEKRHCIVRFLVSFLCICGHPLFRLLCILSQKPIKVKIGLIIYFN